ncbi:MAG: DUF898 domain-containing protein [Alphaproteobacteria bacterium]|nr:DUF898 domain-containing protein [Alphaproteobacteria bacterium]
MEIQTLKTSYAGRRWHLFWLALKSSALTVLTLGIYRFWMKTRLRRYYWSAIRPGGVPLEYTGTGVEKLMGFLVAVVIMAFYIGVFNLILVFLSFSILSNNAAAYAMSFVGLIPIYFFAQYRARRYVLARTRWRGLRFGIDAAAWSYAWRAMLHWLATILTLGYLYPRQVYWLEKFRIDRTWLGRARFVQEGGWTMLRPVAKHFYIGLWLSVLAAILGWANEAWFAVWAISIPYAIIGLVHFKVQSFRILAANKNLGESIRFQAAPRTWRVFWIYTLGNFLAGLILTAVTIALIMAVVFAVMAFDPALFNGGEVQFINSSSDPLVRYSVMVLIGLSYFSVFVLWGVLGQVFITLPLMRHYAETVTISNSHQLAQIEQRPRDAFSEAEGFAEALDIGAAI